jgi:hypothetical protein
VTGTIYPPKSKSFNHKNLIYLSGTLRKIERCRESPKQRRAANPSRTAIAVPRQANVFQVGAPQAGAAAPRERYRGLDLRQSHSRSDRGNSVRLRATSWTSRFGETKIIFRGNPVEGETISGGTMGDTLETKCGKK